MDAPRLDDRLRFYFERQEFIDQWAQLPKLGMRFANDFYCSLEDPVSEWAKVVGVLSRRWAIGKTEVIGLFREDWLGSDGQPRVTVVLGWQRDEASFVGDGKPWVGIRVRRSGDHRSTWNLLVPAIAGAESLEEIGEFDVKDEVWPRWRYLPANQEDFWDHLDDVSAHLTSALFAAWDLAAPVLDEAMASAPSLD
jgi:hypothetical protein